MVWAFGIGIIVLGSIIGPTYINLYYSKKIFASSLLAIIILDAILIPKFFKKYELDMYAEVHNNDMVIAYIDTMSVQDLRNKLKACQLNQTNCTIVFAHEK